MSENKFYKMESFFSEHNEPATVELAYELAAEYIVEELKRQGKL